MRAPRTDYGPPAARNANCFAPMGDSIDGPTCGKRATEQRLVGELVVPLCAEHAKEFDEDE